MSATHDIATSDYSLQLAQKHVKTYSEQDELMARHKEAMKCRDCEDFLRLGIEAYKWLLRADSVLRQAAKEGLDVPETAKEALDLLYRHWLDPCPHAEERIMEQEKAGYALSNVEEFRTACETVKNRVHASEMYRVLEDALEGRFFDEAFWSEVGKLRSS